MNALTAAQQAVTYALAGRSKLNQFPRTLEVHGLSPPTMRHFLNNVCSYLAPVNYLEVGIWTGKSLAAAMFGNVGRFVGVDNFSEHVNSVHFPDIPPEKQGAFVRDRVKEVMMLFGKPGDMVYECDCWQFDLSLCPNVDVFCYDAAHDETSQERAMTYFHPCWRDEVVVFVDDWAADGVECGTRKGLAQIPFTVEWETCLPREISATESQANGLFAAVLKRGR